MELAFTEENLRNVDKLRQKYPTAKALVLPVLWLAQRQFGWISPETMRYVAQLLDLPVSHVYGVVTFYTMFNTKPVGKYHVQVCTNVSCQLLGGETIRDHICKKLNVGLNQTTPDNRFTVSEVECLGSCGTAPMMQVNDLYFENLTVEKVDRLLEEPDRLLDEVRGSRSEVRSPKSEVRNSESEVRGSKFEVRN